MKPPYDITPRMLQLVASISEHIGVVSAYHLDKPSPQLRKQSRIQTIHASLSIEGNTLTQEQVTALVEDKRVIGPRKDVLEVLNAIKVYDQLMSFDPYSEKSFLQAHRILMTGLIAQAGKYRTEGVGIFQGSQVAHIPPPPKRIPALMQDLFKYVKRKDELPLIKSCVFHYEMEFIHPFMDGNGRLGRLWQSVILSKTHPIFEFLPFETLINQTQNAYYDALARSDKAGKSTPFIEYMLVVIEHSLADLLKQSRKSMGDIDRLTYFLSTGITEFTRKDYLTVFKNISPATASRDLRKGVEKKMFRKTGNKNLTIYRVVMH